MRQSFIFKTLILILFISFSQLTFAQSSSETSSKTCNSTNVQLNFSKDQKFSLTDNDDRFNMNLRFKKEHTAEVREMLREELGRSNSENGKKQVWTTNNGAYAFELKEGHLYVNIIKDQLKKADAKALKKVGKASLKLVGFNVDVDGSDGHFDIHID